MQSWAAPVRTPGPDGSAPSPGTRRRRVLSWVVSGPGISAALATILGIATVAAITLARPGWTRLEIAITLGPVWLLFGVAWLVTFIVVAANQESSVRRNWMVAPAIVAVCLVLTVGGVVVSGYVRGTTASLTIAAAIYGTKLAVDGTTDLPDGSRILVVAHDRETFQLSAERDVSVENGAYGATLDLSDWPSGRILVVASFSVWEGQPAEVIERFGDEGQNRHGPGVRDDSDGPVLAASANVELTEGFAP